MQCVFSATVAEPALAALYDRLARDHGADLLLGDWEQGKSIAGIMPVRELVVEAATPRSALHDFCFDVPSSVVPVTLGYLSYTYGSALFGLSAHGKTFAASRPLPLGHLKHYAVLLVLRPAGNGTVTVECRAAHDGVPDDVLRTLEGLCREHAPGLPMSPSSKYVPPFGAGMLRQHLRQSMDEAAYVAGVRDVLEHIRNGDTYQLNLSTRFAVSLAQRAFDPLRFFLHCHALHPAPFYAWFSTGQTRIISTSPERFVRVRAGEVLSQPIKGTLAFDRYEPGMERRVVDSPKESAELSMIVDLIRNDIAAHCVYGSVAVPRHKATFIVDSLIQMHSDVIGTLKPQSTCLDLLLDAFPGGSITGCPKRRTMRIIDRLEPHSRDLYCGSIICVEGPQDMDSSIAIRTAWYDAEAAELTFCAGSGIVIGSDPEAEYRETLAKAGKFMRALEA